MKLLTRHTDYAVTALCFLAKQKQPVAVKALGSQLSMPYAFLRGILQKLRKHGVLASIKGPEGGYTLAKMPRDISLYEIMNVFQDTFRKSGCVFKKFPCPRQKRCVLRKKLKTVDNIMRDELKKVSISSLM